MALQAHPKIDRNGSISRVWSKLISDTTAVPPEVAKLYGIALAGLFQIIISDAGRRTREGQSQAKIADELYPIVETSSTSSTAGSAFPDRQPGNSHVDDHHRGCFHLRLARKV